MMIDKRLIRTVRESKKYIAWNVIYQWISLVANITMMVSIADLLSRLFANTADRENFVCTVIVVAAAVGGLQEEVEAVQKLVVHPFDGNVLGFAALGEILFEVAQQPLVFVCRALRDAHAHFGLPPLHIVGKARNEHHRVACRVQVALFDLRGIGRIASASSLERMSMIFTRKSFSRSLT